MQRRPGGAPPEGHCGGEGQDQGECYSCWSGWDGWPEEECPPGRIRGKMLRIPGVPAENSYDSLARLNARVVEKRRFQPERLGVDLFYEGARLHSNHQAPKRTIRTVTINRGANLHRQGRSTKTNAPLDATQRHSTTQRHSAPLSAIRSHLAPFRARVAQGGADWR